MFRHFFCHSYMRPTKPMSSNNVKILAIDVKFIDLHETEHVKINKKLKPTKCTLRLFDYCGDSEQCELY